MIISITDRFPHPAVLSFRKSSVLHNYRIASPMRSLILFSTPFFFFHFWNELIVDNIFVPFQRGLSKNLHYLLLARSRHMWHGNACNVSRIALSSWLCLSVRKSVVHLKLFRCGSISIIYLIPSFTFSHTPLYVRHIGCCTHPHSRIFWNCFYWVTVDVFLLHTLSLNLG